MKRLIDLCDCCSLKVIHEVIGVYEDIPKRIVVHVYLGGCNIYLDGVWVICHYTRPTASYPNTVTLSPAGVLLCIEVMKSILNHGEIILND